MRHLSKRSSKSLKGIFQFKERGQQFIRTHNETLSFAAMRVSNEDRPPVGINR